MPSQARIANDRLRVADCMHALRGIEEGDNFDGAFRLLKACQVCIEHDLSDANAIDQIRSYALLHPFPRQYGEAEVVKYLRMAERRVKRGGAYMPKAAPSGPAC